MTKIECFVCKSTPVNTPIGKLTDYYHLDHIVICETCLNALVVEAYEGQDMKGLVAEAVDTKRFS